MIAEIEEMVSELAERKKVHLAFHVQPEISEIPADPYRLRQIFLNLITNAIKFNREGGEINVMIFKHRNEQEIVCEVHDTGYGIPQEKVALIYEDFCLEEDLLGDERKTSGLGLCLTRKLVDLHGGKLMVETREGVGSTFTFTLPPGARMPAVPHLV
jgi:signal transduction histidine kinase